MASPANAPVPAVVYRVTDPSVAGTFSSARGGMNSFVTPLLAAGLALFAVSAVQSGPDARDIAQATFPAVTAASSFSDESLGTPAAAESAASLNEAVEQYCVRCHSDQQTAIADSHDAAAANAARRRPAKSDRMRPSYRDIPRQIPLSATRCINSVSDNQLTVV